MLGEDFGERRNEVEEADCVERMTLGELKIEPGRGKKVATNLFLPCVTGPTRGRRHGTAVIRPGKKKKMEGFTRVERENHGMRKEMMPY